jgi:DNA-binding HxlR family transcriptional regulator
MAAKERSTMTTTADGARPRSPRHDRRTDPTDDSLVSRSDSEAPTRLSLLDDEYARELLTTLTAGPMRGRELAARCEASRPTVYRRLNSLESAGLVATETSVDPDGHHCKEFRLVRDRLTVRIEDGAITVTASPASTPASSASAAADDTEWTV